MSLECLDTQYVPIISFQVAMLTAYCRKALLGKVMLCYHHHVGETAVCNIR